MLVTVSHFGTPDEFLCDVISDNRTNPRLGQMREVAPVSWILLQAGCCSPVDPRRSDVAGRDRYGLLMIQTARPPIAAFPVHP